MKKQELDEILNKKEENLIVEFKQIGVLNNKNEISRQLVAFANTKGGKLLIGITDQGKIQGEKIDFDKARNKIASIAKDCCSPPIEFESFYFSLKNGDVIVIDIKKRLDIPHAVVERKMHEIFNRLYFIRTPDGTKAVDDFELKWLFLGLEHNLDDNFLIQLNMGINKEFFTVFEKGKIIEFQPYALNHLHSQRYYDQFMYLLKSGETSRLFTKDDEGLDQLSLFLFDMLPYVVLRSISNYYTKSWNIEIISNSPLKTRVINSKDNSDIISLDQLQFQGTEAFSVIKDFNFEKYFKYFNQQFYVPKNTRIIIEKTQDEKKCPTIDIIITKEKSFSIKIEFNLKEWNKIEKDPDLFFVSLPDITYRVDIDTKFSVEINPNTMLKKEYEEYIKYARTFLELLKWNWDYDYTQDKLSPNQLMLMNRNIERILENTKEMKSKSLMSSIKSLEKD